jgi:hypothetical protein
LCAQMKMNKEHNPKPTDHRSHTQPKGTKILGLLNNPPPIVIPILCYWIENGKQ